MRPLNAWEDLLRYVQRFSIDPYYGMSQPGSLLEYPLSEYGWQLVVLGIFEAGWSFETSFAVISMLALGVSAYVLLRETGRPVLLLIFCNPALIDFYISQVRSALAFAIVLGLISRRLPLALGGIVLASTVHTSMLLFAAPLLLNWLRERLAGGALLDERQASHFWPMIALFAGLLLASFQIVILDFLGDRRADYATYDTSTGLLLTLGWASIAACAYALACGRAQRAMLVAMFLVGMFVVSSTLGLYSHRYVAFFAPFLALALGGRETPPDRLAIFFVIYAAFSSVYFGYWL